MSALATCGVSALPGHDRIPEDEKRAEAAVEEWDRPTRPMPESGAEFPELRLYTDRGVRRGGPGAVSQPTN